MFGIYFLSGNPTWKVASGGVRQGKRGQKFSSQSINNSCFYTSVNSRLIKKVRLILFSLISSKYHIHSIYTQWHWLLFITTRFIINSKYNQVALFQNWIYGLKPTSSATWSEIYFEVFVNFIGKKVVLSKNYWKSEPFLHKVRVF